MPDSPQDVHKKSLGRKGEKLAEKYLKSAGYKILRKKLPHPFRRGRSDRGGRRRNGIRRGENPFFRRVRQACGSRFRRQTQPLSENCPLLLAGNGPGTGRPLRRGGSLGRRQDQSSEKRFLTHLLSAFGPQRLFPGCPFRELPSGLPGRIPSLRPSEVENGGQMLSEISKYDKKRQNLLN